MKIKFILLVLFVFVISNLFAKPIDSQLAILVGKNFFESKSGSTKNLLVDQVIESKSGSSTIFYIINFKPTGYVVVSADDATMPVLGYSLNGNYIETKVPDGLQSILAFYEEQILYVRNLNIEANEKIASMWSDLKNNNQTRQIKEVVVPPLTEHIKWDQGSGWNQECPSDPTGPGGHVYAGCVATAGAIVLKYWGHPYWGTGTAAYSSSYGVLSANFNTYYNWDAMDPVTPTFEAAQLIYHLAVGVSMSFSPTGSGAYTADLVSVLENKLKYSTDAIYRSRSSYPVDSWVSMLKVDIDASRPVIYSGRASNGSGGHAFVCDGYDTDNMFHFNFGWSGSSNGYFLVTAIIPGGDNDFSYGQGAIFSVYPKPNTYQDITNLTATRTIIGENNTNVEITWEAPASGTPTNYKIYKNGSLLATVPNTQFSRFEEGLVDGDLYYCIVANYGGSNDSYGKAVKVKVSTHYNVLFKIKKAVGGGPLSGSSVNLNGVSRNTNFVGETLFEGAAYNLTSNYTVSKTGYQMVSSDFELKNDSVVIVYMDLASGINDNKDNIVTIYPNPSKGYIEVNVESNSELVICTPSGQQVYSTILTANKNSLDLSNLKSGVYFVVINSETKKIVQKLILN